MAIGDAVVQFMGTAITNRQPSSGVEEQISSIIKPEATDAINLYDGSTAIAILQGSIQTDNAATYSSVNSAYMISNTIYLRKTGTTDVVAVSGVQTNS